MARHFLLDASALGKRYLEEAGSANVNYLFGNVPVERLSCLKLGTLEIVSILVRAKNRGDLSPQLLTQASVDFRQEILDSKAFTRLDASDDVIAAAPVFIYQYSLNGTDALLLQRALRYASELKVAGNELVVVAADLRLLKAAQAEGLATFNPETMSQAELDALLAS
jgi:predicted nucleic acid-binding protein